MLKFPERPSAATAVNPTATASRGRLDRALLRPSVDEEQTLIDFFLPKETELSRLESLEENPIDAATAATVNAMTGDEENIDEVFPNVAYERIRTYEVVSQMAPEKEFLLTFSEEVVEDENAEDDMFGDDEHKTKKRKGAFFKTISMRSQLRKTRLKTRQDIAWDKVRLGFREPGDDEVEDREKLAKSVTDSAWVEEQMGDEGVDTFAEALDEAEADIV